ncbi:hypothetical protein Peur_002413 [Populus x canadensis]
MRFSFIGSWSLLRNRYLSPSLLHKYSTHNTIVAPVQLLPSSLPLPNSLCHVPAMSVATSQIRSLSPFIL